MKKLVSSTVLSWTLFGAVGLAGVIPAVPAIAQEAPMRVLTVTGKGSERIESTIARVDLGVEIQGQTAEEVQQIVAQRSSAVIELLRSRNVERLQTTGIQLNPQYNYEDGQGRIVGYIGSNTVSFEMPADAVGTVLDDAVTAGATQIRGISFAATDEAIAAARDIALRQAAADAQSQANVVLGALDLGAEEIVGIQINGASGPIPIPLPVQARVAEAAADYSTPVIGGEQTVEATVTLQIRY